MARLVGTVMPIGKQLSSSVLLVSSAPAARRASSVEAWRARCSAREFTPTENEPLCPLDVSSTVPEGDVTEWTKEEKKKDKRYKGFKAGAVVSARGKITSLEPLQVSADKLFGGDAAAYKANAASSGK